jgi:hypothetical protein
VYHELGSREDRQEWWDLKTSSKVTWTLLNVPRATVVKGDNCAVGPENKVIRDFRIRKGGPRRLNTPTSEVASWQRSAST